MKKSRNKNRSSNTTQLQPASKRRKISPTEETSDPGHGEKRKLEIPSTNQQAKRQKLVQKDIRDIIRSQGTPSHRPPPMEDAKTYKLLGTCSRPVVPSPPEIPPNLQDEESSTTPNNQSTTTPNTPQVPPTPPTPNPEDPPEENQHKYQLKDEEAEIIDWEAIFTEHRMKMKKILHVKKD
jgi:hypothetical protein